MTTQVVRTTLDKMLILTLCSTMATARLISPSTKHLVTPLVLILAPPRTDKQISIMNATTSAVSSTPASIVVND